jgi:simple sugar transport system ATP-binding protein
MAELLSMRGIVKIYPNGVVANNGVDFSVDTGEIHALAGENGAGKTTLMKILFGVEEHTDGQIFLNGEHIRIKSPVDAIYRGFGMVYQHFMLVESMTVAENIVLGMEPVKGIFLNRKKILAGAEKIIKKYDFSINPDDKIQDLPIGTRQKVEILKALFRDAKLLILDEPTSVLTPQETSELFQQLKTLKKLGPTIIFISHKLNEIKEICDRITIMRQGKIAGVYRTDDVSEHEIASLMIGKDMDWTIDKTPSHPGNVVLSVNKLGAAGKGKKNRLRDISFTLRESEILGIVGVEGNGQQELVESITGLRKFDSGAVELCNVNIARLSIKKIRKLGLSHIPQDRMTTGAVLPSSIKENVISVDYNGQRLSRGIFLNLKKIDAWSRELIRDFQIKADSPELPVKMLSGGNLQKVIVAREFNCGARCIVANQPTRGVDIGAARFIHEKLIELRDKGAAILLISADLTEVTALSDRLLVLYDGGIAADFDTMSGLTEEEIGLYMLGIKQQRRTA